MLCRNLAEPRFHPSLRKNFSVGAVDSRLPPEATLGAVNLPTLSRASWRLSQKMYVLMLSKACRTKTCYAAGKVM